MGKYYAIIGRKGVAVANSWPAACALRNYLQHTNAVGFDTFRDAEDYALNAFSDRFPNSSYAPLSLSVNRPAFAGRNKGGW